MNRYSVKLVRRLDQSAVVAVDAENASDAAHKAIKEVPLFWRTDVTESTWYESVSQVTTDCESCGATANYVKEGVALCDDCRVAPESEREEKNIVDEIAGYRVEFDGSYDGDDYVTSVFIESGSYSASLAKAEDTLTLEHSTTGAEVNITRHAVDRIRIWAEDHGY